MAIDCRCPASAKSMRERRATAEAHKAHAALLAAGRNLIKQTLTQCPEANARQSWWTWYLIYLFIYFLASMSRVDSEI